ncbi:MULTISPECIES: hypothetical protein [Pseudomonas]|jgi:hypothetical protein|uniref:Uncharacterized protein n=1 Tax=Pseudomonas shahriarae TaxID=2745512 RepID=A0ABT5NIA0_9PSED|nr:MULTISPECIES: hypothetical protein [Pseudomonas]MDD0987174.1 hypothetical protein [Pseudomonas shahriarae]MDD1032210.1 hypothetical protein [Pseudomonas shahriarae]
MLRLSSQSKSTPWAEVAETSDTGMCTKPKLIAPFHIARGIAVLPDGEWSSGDLQPLAKVSAVGRLAQGHSKSRVTPAWKVFSYQIRTQGVACYRMQVFLAL